MKFFTCYQSQFILSSITQIVAFKFHPNDFQKDILFLPVLLHNRLIHSTVTNQVNQKAVNAN